MTELSYIAGYQDSLVILYDRCDQQVVRTDIPSRCFGLEPDLRIRAGLLIREGYDLEGIEKG